MDVYRKKNSNNMSPSPGPPVAPAPPTNPSIAPLITMLAVLAIILIFCFCGAPAVRNFCRKRVCYCCPEPVPEATAGTSSDNSNTPTIILLPFGRMLVVDRSVFAQLQVDDTGLDFMQLSANLIHAHHLQYSLGGSTASILDSGTTSKGLSPMSLGFGPPSYDATCADKRYDLPPSYSEVSFMFKQIKINDNSSNQHNNLHLEILRNFDSVISINEHINELVDDEPNNHTIHINPKYLASQENFEDFDEQPSNSYTSNS